MFLPNCCLLWTDTSLLNASNGTKAIGIHGSWIVGTSLSCFFFGQTLTLNSLRSISVNLRAHQHQPYHLGIKRYVDASVISRANERRDWHIFADFGNYLIRLVQPLYADFPVENANLENAIFALDSTTISVSINLCSWAEGKYSRGGQSRCTLC